MKFIYTLLLICSFSSLFGQGQDSKVKFDNRLLEIYDISYLESLQDTQPFIIQRWNYFLDHAYMITELPQEKMSDAYPTIELVDLENLNILKLMETHNLKRHWDKISVYRIANSNKHLVFHPSKEYVKKLNKHYKRSL